jgi:biotin carboxyl carrier protein
MLQVGQRVVAGDPVLTLEAMKLYHSLTAPLTGLVQSIHVTVGDIVSHGQLLVEFEPEVADAAVA